MTETLTELPPGAVLAKTWEDCARHLERHGDMGGEVWFQRPDGLWQHCALTPAGYRVRPGAPGADDWHPQALIPPKWRRCDDPAELAAAVAAGATVEWDIGGGWWKLTSCDDEGTFRVYLDAGFRHRVPVSWEWEPCAELDDLRRQLHRIIGAPYKFGVMLSDDELVERVARIEKDRKGQQKRGDLLAAKLASVPDVPEGCVVVVMPEAVRKFLDDNWHIHKRAPGDGISSQFYDEISKALIASRRPKPEPRTERVPWWEALRDGRRLAACDEGEWFPCEASGIHDDTGERWVGVSNGGVWTIPAPDGTVEVLARDGES